MNLNDILVTYTPTRLIRSLPPHIFVADWIAGIVSSDETLVIFGAMNGEYYGDNSRHLFEWTIQNRPDIKSVWLTRNPDVLEKLQKENKPVADIFSVTGIKLLYQSQVGVFTNSLYDLAPHPIFVPKTLKLIALRHGRSVKRIRFARKNHMLSKWERKQRLKESSLIVYAISTSEFVSDVQEICIQIGREKHIVTGYPRNSDLIDLPKADRERWDKFNEGVEPKRTILYAPTWRHGREPTEFFPFSDLNIDILVSLLEKYEAQLLFRPHVNDYKKFESVRCEINRLSEQSSLIRVATHNKFADVNSILPFVDILISDYSAIYHDFLLLDRPMVFIPYDFEEFEHENGFLYDYYENLPGPAIESFDQFQTYFQTLFSGEDPHQDARSFLRQKIHKYDDGKANERVMSLIDELRNQ